MLHCTIFQGVQIASWKGGPMEEAWQIGKGVKATTPN